MNNACKLHRVFSQGPRIGGKDYTPMTGSLGDYETQLKYWTTTLPHTLSSACSAAHTNLPHFLISDDPQTKTKSLTSPTHKQPFLNCRFPSTVLQTTSPRVNYPSSNPSSQHTIAPAQIFSQE
ncbi:hypothetical protein CDAR_179081 [Caerostris darwini]|uniref:Uncharacterized protein n=1 Tax=Caerostris darwini TaxID=1538125 RepID=A0AAV4PD94_9ARAC|nr:hypothetical protein CDAR_179081 [Caerostris darwini]